ncbi:tRNA threonylcarbamoyladenosine biosynthesis protein TsaB [Methylocucumis oryzae]|uniref:tRNA threonylcarbamoyladenosine biosynthesis protein TsaB n=1 Tax=Methylocucumis oryzae TaxID=1632867 RepID=UPI000ACEAC55
MQEIFWGVYQLNKDGYAELIGNEAVLAADAIAFPNIKGVGIGSAWLNYGEILSKRLNQCLQDIDAHCLPHAATIAKLGLRGFALNQQVPVEHAMPVYLRDKVALKEWER